MVAASKIFAFAATVSTASGLQSAGVLRTPAVACSTPQRPALYAGRSAATLIRAQAETEEFPTLEEELEAGRITQAEYDELTGGISEEQFQAEEAADEAAAELSPEAERVMRGMRSSSGVEFAPWMKVDPEAIAKAKAEREARKARAAASQGGVRSDAMLIDPQAAELGAGGGLKSKVLSEEEVELRWDTQDEVGNAGFVVQRRKGGSENFEDLATYEGFSPLRTKGPGGGSYVYLDDSVDVGTWVYRILDCDTQGQRSAVCQKLVEIESEAEGKQTLIVGVGIFGLALALFVAGTLYDPIQTTATGAKIF
jgi:hypothetical protein